jgi:two-component system response regulator DesR
VEVVAELDRGDLVVPTALETRPDVAVVDIDAQPARQPAGALKVHVRGFIVKDAPAETLADGVRRVARGERVIDLELVAAALETGSTPLTERETDVLRAASSGIPTDQIATQLSLSPATVRNYCRMRSARSAAATASTPSASPATPAGSDPGMLRMQVSVHFWKDKP